MDFSEIERLIGESLPDVAYTDREFWEGEILWDNGEEKGLESAWEEHGYYLWNVNFREKKIVLRRTEEEIIGLSLPKELSKKKIPYKAYHETQEFFKYLIKKYGL